MKWGGEIVAAIDEILRKAEVLRVYEMKMKMRERE